MFKLICKKKLSLCTKKLILANDGPYAYKYLLCLFTDVYVEGGNIRAKITVPDIGCTNGIIHLISNVLFQRDFTIWEAIQGNAQLRYVIFSYIMQTLLKCDTYTIICYVLFHFIQTKHKLFIT